MFMVRGTYTLQCLSWSVIILFSYIYQMMATLVVKHRIECDFWITVLEIQTLIS